MSLGSKTVLLLLIAFISGFVLGLGLSFWEWQTVQWVTVIFYTVALIGVIWGGYEALWFVRNYRVAIAHRLDASTQIFANRVRMPALPKPEVLQLDPEFIKAVENEDIENGV